MFTGSRNLEPNDISDIWNNLDIKSQNETRSYTITLRIFPNSQYNLFLGYDTHKNQRLLLMKIKTENEPCSDNFPKSKGFTINKLHFPHDSDEYLTIGLILLENQYLDIFTILVNDVVNHIIAEKNEKSAIHTFLLRLKIWQQFLDKCGNDGLSHAEQIGLYGELRFLNDYLIPMFGSEKAVFSWIGPDNGRQDFQIEGMAFEVKTSAGKTDEFIHISSEEQLNDQSLRALFLYHLFIREIRNSSETLPNLIDQIQEKIYDDITTAEKFETLLMKSGYLEDHRKKYADHAYSDRTINVYHVTGNFPRIIPEQLVEGVGNVSYTLNLSACNPFRISENDFKSKIGSGG